MKKLILLPLIVVCLLVCNRGSAFALLPTNPGPSPSPTPTTAPNQGLIQSSQCPTTDDKTKCVEKVDDPAIQGCTSPKCDIVQGYLNPFIKLLAILAGIAVVIGLIVGGIQYSASGGDPQKVSNAKRHIRNSILALLAFLFLYAFLKFLSPGSGVFG